MKKLRGWGYLQRCRPRPCRRRAARAWEPGSCRGRPTWLSEVEVRFDVLSERNPREDRIWTESLERHEIFFVNSCKCWCIVATSLMNSLQTLNILHWKRKVVLRNEAIVQRVHDRERVCAVTQTEGVSNLVHGYAKQTDTYNTKAVKQGVP